VVDDRVDIVRPRVGSISAVLGKLASCLYTVTSHDTALWNAANASGVDVQLSWETVAGPTCSITTLSDMTLIDTNERICRNIHTV